MAIVHQARVGRPAAHAALAPCRALGTGPQRRDRAAAAADPPVLADLVAARRPTVTTALSELDPPGLVRTDGEPGCLPGEAPSDLPAFARRRRRRRGRRAAASLAPQLTVHIDPYIVLGSADHRPARRHDRRRRRRADDADADPAVRRDPGGGDLERSRGGGRDAPVRRRRPPAGGDGQPQARPLDGDRLGAGRVPRRVPAARARQLQIGADAHRDRARSGAAGRGERDGAAVLLDRRSGHTASALVQTSVRARSRRRDRRSSAA